MLNSNLAIVSGIVGISKSKKVETPNGGKTVCRMSIDHIDEYNKKHSFYVDCWEKLAEKASAFKKGTHVLVTAKLIMDKWQTSEGNKTLVIIKAQDVQEISKGSDFRMNIVVFSGNLTQEPVLKLVQTDKDAKKTVSSLIVCQNDWKKVPHFVAVESWNKLAKTTNCLTKGALIEVRGNLIQKVWGENNSQVLIVADEIDFVLQALQKK